LHATLYKQALRKKTKGGIYMLKFILGGSYGSPLLLILLYFMGSDIITGVLKDYKVFSFSVAFKGLGKKLSTLIIITCATITETYFEIKIGEPVILYFMAMEGISIIENVAVLGVIVPTILKDTLTSILKKEGGEEK
jgi:toxin secretion/phage lysis holin